MTHADAVCVRNVGWIRKSLRAVRSGRTVLGCQSRAQGPIGDYQEENKGMSMKSGALQIETDKPFLQLYAEIMIHKLMAHPHVVPFREAFEDEDQVYILLGLCEYGVRHQDI